MTPELWEEVKQKFDEITDSDPREKQRILDSLSEEIRREVVRLLANYEDSGVSPDTVSNILPRPSVVAALLRDTRAFEEGDVLLKRFQVRRFLGGGGMGEVYEAWDEKTGEVALKTLRPELSTLSSTLESFRREVTRGRQVSHPNVCGIYDLFETDDPETPVPFFTMQLIKGRTLASLLANGSPLPEESAREIALQLCEGLHAAHKTGVIHGDFKCGNVMIGHDADGFPKAIITDFGLAQLMPRFPQTEMQRNAPVAGTKPYLALELMSGSTPSVASDLFALGVVLFRIKTGKYWFSSEGDWEAARETRATPPSRNDLAPLMDKDWAEAIHRCLAALPGERPMSAAEVRDYLNGAWSRRRGTSRRTIFSFGAATAAAVAGGWWITSHWRPAGPPFPSGKLRTLVEDFDSNGFPPASARAVRNLFCLGLSRSKRVELLGLPEIHRALETRGVGGQAVRGTAAQEVAAAAKATLAIRGSIKDDGGSYNLTVEAIDPATGQSYLPPFTGKAPMRDLPRLVSQAVASIRAELDGSPAFPRFDPTMPEQADTENADALESFSLGLSLYNAGEPDAALAKLGEATRLDPNFAIAHSCQALIHIAYNRDDLALPSALKAYDLRNRLNVHHQLYTDYFRLLLLGDYENAATQLNTLVNFFPTDPALHRNLAQSFRNLEKNEAALEHARKSVDLDPDNAMNHNLYVAALADNGQASKADRAIDVALKRIPNAPPLIHVKAYLAYLKLDHTSAVQIVSQLIQRGGPATQSHSLAARANILGGRLDEASADLEQQIRLRETSGAAVEEMFRYWLGQIAALRGDLAVAARHAELLHQRPVTPPGLHAFRMAAELAWLADRRDLLAQIAAQMRTIERIHSSTRSKGFRLFAEALDSSARGRASEAVDLMAKSLEFWPDVTGQWISAELMVEAKMYPQALGQFRKVVDAQRSALRFFAVSHWVRSLSRTAWCLEKTGQANSASYKARFEQLWGASDRYRLARHA